MNLKPLYIATGALAALALITYFVKNADSSAPADPRVGQPLIAEAALREVTRIRLENAEQTLHFRFDRDNGRWLLEERFDLPVDMAALSRATTQLTEARIERLVSSNPDRIADFGFGDRRLTLLAEDGSEVASIELGRETDAGKQLVAFGDEEKAFLINDQLSLRSDLVAWLDKQLLEFDRAAARRASFALGSGEQLTVERSSATDPWTTSDALPEGKELDRAAVDRVVNRLASLRFTDLLEPNSPEAQDAAANSHQIEIELEDGTRYEFRIGRRPERTIAGESDSETEEASEEPAEEETVPAGPVVVFIESSQTDDPINEYMDKTAFVASAQLYTSLPRNLSGLLQDAPEPETSEEQAE